MRWGPWSGSYFYRPGLEIMGCVPPQGCEWAHEPLGLQLFLNRLFDKLWQILILKIMCIIWRYEDAYKYNSKYWKRYFTKYRYYAIIYAIGVWICSKNRWVSFCPVFYKSQCFQASAAFITEADILMKPTRIRRCLTSWPFTSPKDQNKPIWL